LGADLSAWLQPRASGSADLSAWPANPQAAGSANPAEEKKNYIITIIIIIIVKKILFVL
jgi:hypothetical protein